jgi:ribose/xylose/arabinose/galactoside ABC-type transport system permease subunit
VGADPAAGGRSCGLHPHGENFLSQANGFEIARLGVEVGLLALALTPVIVTGGIDLSVSSMMGLAAVTFGWLWRDGDWPIALAAWLRYSSVLSEVFSTVFW